MPSSAVDDALVVCDKLHGKIYLRACRTPDRKRVVGAWALLEDMHKALPRKGWNPPVTPCPRPFKIVSIESKGRAMVATRKIQKGEIIVHERPIIIIPKFTFSADSQHPWIELEKLLLQLVYWLEQSDREQFLQLYNCKPLNISGPLSGIARTNSLAACMHTSDSWMDYCAVCLNISYVNHSCDPNASHDFDQKTMTMQLRAARDIESGEEVTISYIDRACPKADRQNELKTKYYFTCDCSLCLAESQSDPIKDNYRRFIIKTLDNVEKMWDDLLRSPPRSRRENLERDIKMMELVLQALNVVDIPGKRIKVSQHLALVYSLTGDLKNFRIWAADCMKILETEKTPGVGGAESLYDNWNEWYRNPRKLPSWQMWS